MSLHFLDSTYALDEGLSGTYHLPLAALSVLIACLASYGSLSTVDRIRKSKIPLHRYGWLIAGALAMGSGVWAMHFVGMLALALPFPVDYGISTTLISMIPAVCAAAVMIHVVSATRINRMRIAVGGTLMGLGIGAMHYTGMMAMKMNAVMRYDPVMFTVSILVAILLAICAILVKALIADNASEADFSWQDVAAAIVMGLAVSAMHYTAMTATYFFPNDGVPVDVVEFNPKYLGILVASIATVIITVLFAATLIGRQMEAHAQVSDARARLTDILRIAPEAVISTGEDMKIQLFNRSAEKIFGYSADEVIGQPVEILIPEEFKKGHRALVRKFAESGQSTQFMDTRKEVFGLRKNDVAFPVSASVSQLKMEGEKLYTVILRDITEQKELQRKIEKLAHYDSLTDLPNRNLFEDRLRLAIAGAKRNRGEFAFIYLDLDGFKTVNDTYGHKAGDLVLQEVARRLAKCIRETDTVARMGGDEFAIILVSPVTVEDSFKIAERILETVSAPINGKGQTFAVGASLGISIYPSDTDDPETLLKFSDEAMYRVKESGRNGIRFYNG